MAQLSFTKLLRTCTYYAQVHPQVNPLLLLLLGTQGRLRRFCMLLVFRSKSNSRIIIRMSFITK